MSRGDTLVAGVDGCPRGWVAVVGPTRGGPLWMVSAPTFSELIDLHPRVTSWAVDIPIGLASDGPRECDAAARRELSGGRASSVFSAPPLAALAASTYAEACQLAAAATGKKLSKQTWNLVAKIREVRSTLLSRPALRRRVFETHPELSFSRLAGEPVTDGKKSGAGAARRSALLAEAVGEEAVARFKKQAQATRGIGVDDALDAAACWTSAARAGVGAARSLPEHSMVDATGLSIAIRW